MALRCGCENEADDTVFGLPHTCSLPERTAMPGEPLPPIPECAYPPGAVPLDLPRFIPSWRFVVPETSEEAPGIPVISCTPPPVEGVAADNLQQELDRLEPRPAQYDGDPDGWTELRPYERVLSDDCEPGDLG
jgi:hypothetical protein